METLLKFKTNINCNGCKTSVTPFLDNAEGVCHWDVDLENENKVLTVHSTGITSEKVTEIVEKAGYKAKAV